jgi:hypothetical protein
MRAHVTFLINAHAFRAHANPTWGLFLFSYFFNVFNEGKIFVWFVLICRYGVVVWF